MSYNLSINGHHGDASVAAAIDELVQAKGREIVDAVLELDPSAVASASFSGPSGHVNYLAAPVDETAGEDAAPPG